MSKAKMILFSKWAEVTEKLPVNHLIEYIDDLENELEDVKMTRWVTQSITYPEFWKYVK